MSIIRKINGFPNTDKIEFIVQTVDGFPMVCPGLNLCMSHQNSNMMYDSHPLNSELLIQLENRGWIITGKLAEGGFADVFTCKNYNTVAVILFLVKDFMNLEYQLSVARQHPKIFTIVYDIFSTSLPYSLDPMYIKDQESPFEGRTIQVIEKLDMSLSNYIKLFDNKTLLEEFRIACRDIIIGYLRELHYQGIYYWDLKDDNIGIIALKDGGLAIKFMDLASISTNYADITENFNGFEEFIADFYNKFGRTWRVK